jgi:hypothetical protein
VFVYKILEMQFNIRSIFLGKVYFKRPNGLKHSEFFGGERNPVIAGDIRFHSFFGIPFVFPREIGDGGRFGGAARSGEQTKEE